MAEENVVQPEQKEPVTESPKEESPKEEKVEVIEPEILGPEEEASNLGRPRKEINYDQFEKLCQLQCTEEDIASFFMMDRHTLNERCKEHYEGKTFKEAAEPFKAQGRISLQREQYRSAIQSKNIKMQIHLGQQWLGQATKIEQTNKGDIMDGITFKDWMIYCHKKKGLPVNEAQPKEAEVKAETENG